METSIINLTDKDEEITVRNSIYDNKGELVSSVNGDYKVSVDEKNTVSQDVKITQPELWSIDSPYLYTCVTEIEKDGTTIDRKKTMTGTVTVLRLDFWILLVLKSPVIISGRVCGQKNQWLNCLLLLQI